MRKLVLSFLLAGLLGEMSLANAKSYSLRLLDNALLGSTELKPGEYNLEVLDKNAVIRRGKLRAEAPVQVETADSKYNATTVRFRNGDGKNHIQEIHIGGTRTRLVFAE